MYGSNLTEPAPRSLCAIESGSPRDGALSGRGAHWPWPASSAPGLQSGVRDFVAALRRARATVTIGGMSGAPKNAKNALSGAPCPRPRARCQGPWPGNLDIDCRREARYTFCTYDPTLTLKIPTIERMVTIRGLGDRQLARFSTMMIGLSGYEAIITGELCFHHVST